MNDFRENLGNKLEKYIKLKHLTYMSFRKNGLGEIGGTIKRGSTKFNTLFDISVFLEIDIRNLLMFNDDTYEFKNSFETFEEFFIYIGKKFKNYRLCKKLKAIDIGNEDTIYAFENGKKTISMKKFYEYLGNLGMTSDEFFLEGEEYSIRGATKRNFEDLKYVEDELESEPGNDCMNDFRENLGKKLDKYIKLKHLTYMSFRKNGLGEIGGTIKRGSTKFNTLFDISVFLEIDIRNLLMFNDDTYEFKNSFISFEEFFNYIRQKFRKIRIGKGMKAIDLDNNVASIYRFENGKEVLSFKKFYSCLDKLGITSDEFFLEGEEYSIKGANKRIFEKLEYVKDELESESDDECMNDFRENLGNKIDRYIKLNNFTRMSLRANGLGEIGGTIRRGSTRFKSLIDIASFLTIDVRNLLMFDDNTYIFKDSFSNFEEFFIYIGNKFKDFRIKKGLKASDIDKEIATVYKFESGKKMISLKKFYEYLDELGMTSDEFFLEGEEYKIAGSQHIKESSNNIYSFNNITLEDIFNRVDELEIIRGVKVAKSVIPTRNVMPTVYVFLRICNSLKVSPSDFLDFNNKNPKYIKSKIDSKEFINDLKKTINANTENSKKFLRLDNIYSYCSSEKIDVKLFIENLFSEHTENKGFNINVGNLLK